ncbi:MAG: GtrA family protein [Clostridia bacterium]|nr:GtrA family protein [Clostridia bacterium]
MKLKKWYEALRDRIVSVGFFKKLYAIPFIHRLLEYEIVSYLVFGVLTTLVNFTVCWLMNRLPAVLHPGADYETYVLFSVGRLPILWTYLTNTVGWTAAVLFAFVTNKLFVFESKDRSAGTLTRELTTFIGARVLSLLLFELLLFAGLQRLLGHFWIPKILSAVANVVFNYIASKLVIFRKKEETGEPSC